MSLSNRSLIALDFDGTMAVGGHPVSSVLEVLEHTLPRNVVRVVATGRSLASIRESWPEPWPLDYLIFSSGAGLYDCSSRRLCWKRHLKKSETEWGLRLLETEAIDYMVHFPIPDNHRFFYRRFAGHPDFERRIEHYRTYAVAGVGPIELPGELTQIIAIGDEEQISDKLLLSLSSHYSVIRSTSPLDGKSFWLELFSKGVDKGSGLALLCDRLKIDRKEVLAVGNDFNDLHMLRWAGSAAVVEGFPLSHAYQFHTFPPASEGGAASAVMEWLSSSKRRRER